MKRIEFNKSITITAIILIVSSFSWSCKDKTDNYFEEMLKLKKYIADNNITTQPTSSGLYYIETVAGTGERARYGLNVSVRYKGYFFDGTVFDQNLDASIPFTFPLGYGYVISGWDEGISYMRVGGKATLIIPSSLAYGYQGSDGGDGGVDIPPYTTLIFEVELVGVE